MGRKTLLTRAAFMVPSLAVILDVAFVIIIWIVDLENSCDLTLSTFHLHLISQPCRMVSFSLTLGVDPFVAVPSLPRPSLSFLAFDVAAK